MIPGTEAAPQQWRRILQLPAPIQGIPLQTLRGSQESSQTTESETMAPVPQTMLRRGRSDPIRTMESETMEAVLPTMQQFVPPGLPSRLMFSSGTAMPTARGPVILPAIASLEPALRPITTEVLHSSAVPSSVQRPPRRAAAAAV